MTGRMHDDHFDRELGRFLDWHAGDTAGAPTANEIAARLSARAGARQHASPLTPQLTWALIALLATMALIGTAIVGASLLAPRPVDVVETSPSPSGPTEAATPTQPPPSPSPQGSPRLGDVLRDFPPRSNTMRERSLVFGVGSFQGVDWVALASTDDMLLVDDPSVLFGEDPGWVCTYTQVPEERIKEITHLCLPPLADGELIGRTAPAFHIRGVTFLHGRADEQVERVELHAGALVTDGVAVPLAAIDLPDKVFALAFPALDGDYTLVAIDAQGNEIDLVTVTPPPPPPTGPPPPPPSN